MIPGDRLSIVVVAAYPAARAGLRSLIEGSGMAGAVVEIAPAALGYLEAIPDVVLAEVEDPALVTAIEEAFPGVPVVYLVQEPGRAAGSRGLPRGFLRRDAEAAEIVAALRAVAAGLTVFDPHFVPLPVQRREAREHGEALTPREHEVLRLLATGIPNKLIARQLGISEHTAKYHVGEILGKLGAASRTEAVTIGVQRGLLPL
jgi:DNA-binding NarL/FixJ family response regulator